MQTQGRRCRGCNKTFDARGVTTHEKACVKRIKQNYQDNLYEAQIHQQNLQELVATDPHPLDTFSGLDEIPEWTSEPSKYYPSLSCLV